MARAFQIVHINIRGCMDCIARPMMVLLVVFEFSFFGKLFAFVAYLIQFISKYLNGMHLFVFEQKTNYPFKSI